MTGNIKSLLFEEDELEIIELYQQKISNKSICNQYQITESQLMKLIDSYGVSRKRKPSSNSTPNPLKDVYRYYDLMFTQQKGKCAICNKEETELTRRGKIKKLSIDHSHTTGMVRGLLCNSCNKLLGFAKDDTRILKSSIKYIEKNIGRYIIESALSKKEKKNEWS